jgi:hypothetical protein
MLGSINSVHASGSRIGQVFFRVEHPITKASLNTLFIVSVEGFCRTHGLVFDREFYDKVIEKLEYDLEKGWSIPKSAIDLGRVISSVNDYLREIQSDLF